MRHALLAIMAVFSIMVLSNQALASGCYSDLEAEAEQGIRIHSELMVIGLNCQHMGAREGMNIYSQYRQFTADHGDLFSRYEGILMDYFQRNGGGKPEDRLNTLRTNFANKISNDVATMRPDVFCSTYVPRIQKASELNHDELRRWAATIYDSHPVSKPLCTG